MRLVLLSLFLFLSILICGCSGGGNNPVSLGQDEMVASENQSPDSNSIWGMWQFTADPKTQTVEVLRLRTAEKYFNILPLLETQFSQCVSIEGIPEFDGDTLKLDIGIQSPFHGKPKYTGFDVSMILITRGSLDGFSDPDIVMHGEGDTRLLNPDGYTRWWNPREFPHNTGDLMGYTDGKLGTKDEYANYTATINGYKYYCSDLIEPDSSMNLTDPAGRGVFPAGGKLVREHIIDIDGGMVFNYIVNACWGYPLGNPPWEIPDDFPEYANRYEPYRIDVAELENTLWNDGVNSGGNLSLRIDAYDWFNSDQNRVRVESPGNFNFAETFSPTGGGTGYSTYEVEIPSATPAYGSIDLLISIESEKIGYYGLLPGAHICAYFTEKISVSHGGSQEPIWPTFQYDQQRSGRCPYNGPQTNRMEWSFHTSNTILPSPAIDKNGIIYFGNYNGEFFAVNPDGTEKWVINLGSFIGTSPAIDMDGAIYVCDQPGVLYKFNSEGDEIWTYQIGGCYSSSPLVDAEGNICIGSDDWYLYCIRPNGTLKWRYQTGGKIWSSPAKGLDGTIYVGCDDGYLYAIDSGNLKWRFQTNGVINPAPTVAEDGTIYVASEDSYLYAIDINGDEIWRYYIGGPAYYSSPAIGFDGTIYIGGESGVLRAINPDGTEKWTFNAGPRIRPSPIIGADGTIYFGSEDNNVYALNPNGTEKWRYTTGNRVRASGAISSDGTLYIGSYDHNMYAFRDD